MYLTEHNGEYVFQKSMLIYRTKLTPDNITPDKLVAVIDDIYKARISFGTGFIGNAIDIDILKDVFSDAEFEWVKLKIL